VRLLPAILGHPGASRLLTGWVVARSIAWIDDPATSMVSTMPSFSDLAQVCNPACEHVAHILSSLGVTLATTYPKGASMNSQTDERFSRLLAFADDVLAVCDALGIDPFLDGSMAVKALTQDPTIPVRDIDLNCSEAEFPRLQRALEEAGIFCEIQDWHVLQARREGLKVEFAATEIWLQGITGPYETLQLGSRTIRMVNRDALRELYQRGFDATAGIPSEREKHEKIAAKLRVLDAGEL